MTQVYDAQGKINPVTVLQVGPNPVLQVKAKGTKEDGSARTGEGDGYFAVQVGFVNKKRTKATRPERGHVSSQMESKRRKSRRDAGVAIQPKAECEPQRYIREFRLDAVSDLQVGAVLKVDEIFKKVKKKVRTSEGKWEEVEAFPAVDVIGTSKGRGFMGVVRRHGFSNGCRLDAAIRRNATLQKSSSSAWSDHMLSRPNPRIDCTR